MASGLAPVKPDYIRKAGARVVVEAVVGSATAVKADAAAGGAATAAAADRHSEQRPQTAKKKSRRQQQKVAFGE